MTSRIADSPTLTARFLDVRRTTEALARPLTEEDCQAQSMVLASPVKWHLAHTTWFFETFVLIPFSSGYRPFAETTNYLFNSYYEAIGERIPRAHRGLMTRPSLDEVLAHRRWVDDAMLELLEGANVVSPEKTAASIDARVVLGLHHEQQHQELILTDVQHLLSLNPLRPRYLAAEAGSELRGAASDAPTPALGWIEHPGGVVSIGKHADDGFGFDNESPRHKRYVEPFRIADRLVTCGEFAEFIADGGYEDPRLWLSDGWDAVRSEGWRWPLYWSRGSSSGGDDGHEEDWFEFTLRGEQPVEAARPVAHVSYFEADAFARWAGRRLLREDEWELVATAQPIDGNFLESRSLRPLAAGRTTADARARQLFGDVWEWTASQYSAYPGYKAPDGALGEYNGKFMCDQFVLRGGSCATPRSHIRATYRNFFQARARWQFSGFRLASDA